MVFDVADDVSVSKLQASANGLNYVDGKFEDIQVGHRVSVSSTRKGSESAGKSPEMTGTVLLLNADKRQITLKISVPADQAKADIGSQLAQTVTIRSLIAKK